MVSVGQLVLLGLIEETVREVLSRTSTQFVLCGFPHKTNNQAERDLRPAKTQLKISDCHRSDTGTRAWTRVRGYISTVRKHGGDVLTAIPRRHHRQPLDTTIARDLNGYDFSAAFFDGPSPPRIHILEVASRFPSVVEPALEELDRIH